MSNIEIYLLVPDETGKRQRAQVKIKANKPTEQLESAYIGVRSSTWKMRLSTMLPAHVHSFLKGKKCHEDGFSSKEDFADLKKTVSNYSLEQVTKRLNHLFDVYCHLVKLHNAPRNKRIWIGFDLAPLTEVKSQWNRSAAGFRLSTKLAYFVGFQQEGGRHIFDIDGKNLHPSYDKIIYEARSVEWTQEREDQIEQFSQRLDEINGSLAQFILQLSDDNFDNALNGGVTPLLLGTKA